MTYPSFRRVPGRYYLPVVAVKMAEAAFGGGPQSRYPDRDGKFLVIVPTS
jgi:hypothetical protein